MEGACIIWSPLRDVLRRPLKPCDEAGTAGGGALVLVCYHDAVEHVASLPRSKQRSAGQGGVHDALGRAHAGARVLGALVRVVSGRVDLTEFVRKPSKFLVGGIFFAKNQATNGVLWSFIKL